MASTVVEGAVGGIRRWRSAKAGGTPRKIDIGNRKRGAGRQRLESQSDGDKLYLPREDS